ncbi:ribulokinase [Arenibacter certesii]|uniref:Ribulokinase n=1 Tax=Arenibacter certesii TaxID=228955 RepID=A0A918IR88_9FLAO|nr:ribulokinase [Arenibacter certesii]GGW28126.1 ribulokinase [Arenibacter certesii]
MSYVIGLDYGTDSVRAILVRCSNGEILEKSVFVYPRWEKGLYCDPEKDFYRQHPLDHLEGLQFTISELVENSKIDSHEIKAICVDTTGSSPMPVNKDGVSLALLPEFKDNPNAMMILWKDHTSIKEAAEITKLAENWGGENFTKYSGGIYSSEWFWSKILSIHRKDNEISQAAFSWMEHCDYITGVLTGLDLANLKRSRCAAGHKALWHKDWDGLPPKEFLSKLDNSLVSLRNNLYSKTYTSDMPAGYISKEWAAKLGLSHTTLIAVGTIDAHAGAVGAGIKENALVKVVGTSTCDMLIVSKDALGKKLVSGICGQVDGSILPGFFGLEAGQSAFGDVLAWFAKLVLTPAVSLIKESQLLDHRTKDALTQELMDSMIIQLSKEASDLSVEDSTVVSLDWINGRRSPYVNESLQGAIMGLKMGTQSAHIFKSLVESLCFGSRRIIDRFEEEGIHIEEVIAIGGVANKSKLVMQTMADILGRSIKTTASTQTPALGAAMYAAVASGVYPTMDGAINNMGPGFDEVYEPDLKNKKIYDAKYLLYQRLGELEEGFNARIDCTS